MRVNKFMPNVGYEILGGLKIKDGLFLGDQYAAQDLEFIITNKITHIINCAGKQIANHWVSLGIQYLTYHWLDIDSQVIFDPKDEVLNGSYKFIEETLNKGESVLVQSVKGHNRSICIIAAFLMRKFRWTLYKTLEYLHSRRPDLEMNANFFNQLMNLEVRLTKMGLAPKTYNWEQMGDDPSNFDSEELLIRNTYLNSKNVGVAEFKDIPDKIVKPKINWIDNFSNEKARLTTILIPRYEDIDFVAREKNAAKPKSSLVHSIMKGSNQSFEVRRDSQKKRLEKVKSSSIIKKSESEVEFYSESNLPMTMEERKDELEKGEERKKPKNVVIKKSADSKYLAFSKSLKGSGLKTASSQKDLTPISENSHDYARKPQEISHFPTDDQIDNIINRQMKREIDQYRVEEERPTSKINYNYNMQVNSAKDLKVKSFEKQSKAAILQEKKDLLFMTYDMPQGKPKSTDPMMFRNSLVRKYRKKRKTNENQESAKKQEFIENGPGKPLIENSLKYSQKIYANKFPQYNNFVITNNPIKNPHRNIPDDTEYFSHSIGFSSTAMRNFPAGYSKDLDSDFSGKGVLNPNRPSTAPPKKDRENLAEKYLSNDNLPPNNGFPHQRDSFRRTNVRQNSAQPSNRESEPKTKINLRAASPAQFTSVGPFQPSPFFSLKPKWKF